jgi:uncharacterized protein YyaL (SSP411 family)
MQRESFADPELASILNRHFVPVKVDRELNPVLDDRLMTFLQASTGRGGWPMNVILTPEGYPILGFVYLPPDQFERVLNEVSKSWQSNREKLTRAAMEVDGLIAKELNARQTPISDMPVADLQTLLLKESLANADELAGGFGDGAKFPSVPQLQALLTLVRLSGDEPARRFLRLTLDKMVASGLHDAVGGGFFRYTVDPAWQIPHFEKMLYTNAQLTELYFAAADVFKEEKYREVALQTLDFMLREMPGQGGALIASLSAVDKQNVEGGYYLWKEDELRKLLGEEEYTRSKNTWVFIKDENLEAGLLPVLKKIAISNIEAANVLLKHRQEERHLPRDEKRLAGWNGLALAALAEGLHHDAKYHQAGEAVRTFLSRSWQGNRLQKALDQRDQGMGPGELPDYAAVAYGLMKWAEASGDEKAGRLGREILLSAWQRFFVKNKWQSQEVSLLPNPLYAAHLPDTAETSPETLMIAATRLALKSTADLVLSTKLEQVLSQASSGMREDTFNHASLIALAVEAAESQKVINNSNEGGRD